jgi:hypothetical protein
MGEGEMGGIKRMTDERLKEIAARCDAATLWEWPLTTRDALFISAVRQDIPDLLADIEELRISIMKRDMLAEVAYFRTNMWKEEAERLRNAIKDTCDLCGFNNNPCTDEDCRFWKFGMYKKNPAEAGN